uniref:Protein DETOXIFICATION n=1 Tax=Ananas comosus var. bracteatus TaxID=296719 RepID=A0A6V7NUE4_ANACO|nr:unnamed protein product [Ananas comosus var. bracteatus]
MKPPLLSQRNKRHISSYLITVSFILFVAFLYGEDLSCILRLPFRSDHLSSSVPSPHHHQQQQWVYDEAARPLYQEEECPYIQPQLTCQEHGRPERRYQHWRWQPHGCSLPSFNATFMLEKLHGKRMMFVGDSLNRGQFVSMVCLLHRIIPEDAKSIETNGSLTVFKAKEYNASIEFYWAPFLVESNSDDAVVHRISDRIVRAGSINKHARHWRGVDLLVFNTYLWWMTGSRMKILRGSFEGDMKNITEMETEDAYGLSLRRVVRWVDKNVDPQKTRVFFVTMSPTHTRSQEWGGDPDGNCYNETTPITDPTYWGAARTKSSESSPTLLGHGGKRLPPPPPPRPSPLPNPNPNTNPTLLPLHQAHNPSFLCFRKPRPTKSQQNLKTKKNRSPKPINLPFLSPFSRFLDRIKGDGIGLEILSIALPAVLALAADPIASLVDTAFVGHLGSVELAAVGVSVSVFNLVSKLFNVPLLNVTTSFVAEQQALDSNANSDADGGDKTVRLVDGERRKFLPAVSTSLALAAVLECLKQLHWPWAQMTPPLWSKQDSPMRTPAEQFLSLRAYGAPPIVIALAAQGTFRGFMDTKTPLYAVGVGNLLNAILDPILIFILGLGVSGAAIATVISEYLIAFILLWKLNRKVILISPNIINNGIIRYLKSGALLIGRTVAVLLTMTLATSMAAREGPVPMAGHQICLQVWLAVSLLNDALALAGQALLASEYTKKNYGQARLIVCRVLQIGAIAGVTLAVILFFGFGTLSFIFTSDPEVLAIARSGVWFVTISQPINAIAFVIDGLYYGVSDFAYAAYSMVWIFIPSLTLHALALFGLTSGITSLP